MGVRSAGGEGRTEFRVKAGLQVNDGSIFKATCTCRKENSEVGYAYRVFILGLWLE